MFKKAFTSLILTSLSVVMILFTFPGTASAHSSTTHSGSPHATYTITYGKPQFVPAIASNITYGCHDLYCDGKDPVKTHCNQSALSKVYFVVFDQNTHEQLTEGYNIYSKGCQANWTEADRISPNGVGLYITGLAMDSSRNTYSVCFPGNDVSGNFCTHNGYYAGPAWPAYTDMVDGSYTYTACIYVKVGGWNDCANQ